MRSYADIYAERPLYFADKVFHHRYWHDLPGYLLEVGCSTGHFLGNGNRVGIDRDRAALAVAERKGFKVEAVDITRPMPLKIAGISREQFWGIEMRHVIEHLPDPLLTLTNLHAWMRKDSRILIETPNILKLGWEFYDAHYEHVRPFSAKTLRQIILDAGFVDVKVEYGKRGIWGGKFLNRHGYLHLDLAARIQDRLPQDKLNLIATAWRA